MQPDLLIAPIPKETAMADPGHDIDLPPGFERMPTFGPFHAHAGPMYVRCQDGVWTVGLRVEDKHRNRMQAMHGGMICTLADTATHWAAKQAQQPARMLLTTNLAVNLMGNAAPGEWVEARAQVLRSGRSIVFAQCLITCGSRTIAQASAQFQAVGEDTLGPAPVGA
ncbi:MAG TPA: PaaI family thioesterase [Ramlibacter sp.]|nr:PaaI family thioesterase [Ramlibacter sp.]